MTSDAVLRRVSNAREKPCNGRTDGRAGLFCTGDRIPATARSSPLALRKRVDSATLSHTWVEGNADGHQRGGPSRRGGMASSGYHGVVRLGRGQAEDAFGQGRYRQRL